jgi:hypothetical protein
MPGMLCWPLDWALLLAGGCWLQATPASQEKRNQKDDSVTHG